MMESMDSLLQHLQFNVELDLIKGVLIAVTLVSISAFLLRNRFNAKNVKKIEESNPPMKCPFSFSSTNGGVLPNGGVGGGDVTKKKTPKVLKKSKTIDSDQGRDFLDAQIERDKIIKEKLVNFTPPNEDMFLLKQLDEIELSKDERDKEIDVKKNQLDHIFAMLKKQENGGSGGCRGGLNSQKSNDSSQEEFKFSVLKEDGTYEKKEVELKNDFESQMKLYGL